MLYVMLMGQSSLLISVFHQNTVGLEIDTDVVHHRYILVSDIFQQ